MKRKITKSVSIPEFNASLAEISPDSKIFVDKSLEIAHYIFQLMEEKKLKQKDIADRMEKTEAEVSKWLGGMHNFTLRSLSKLEAAIGATIVTTPKNVRRSVPVTSINNNISIVTERRKRPDVPVDYMKVIYMNTKKVNNVFIEESVAI